MRSRPGGLRVHIIKKSTNDVVACCVEREPPLKEILPPTKVPGERESERELKIVTNYD